MPIQRRRTDGYAEDGSYSVAADFDKQIGQALAEREARIKDPRYVPGGQVERPDAPDLLDRELLDPVMTAFGMPTSQDRLARHGRHDAPSSRVFEMGNQLVRVDPNGQASPVYTSPKKEEKAPLYEVPTGVDLLGKPTTKAKMTLHDLEAFAPTLPDLIRTNAPIPQLLELAKSMRGTNAPSGPVKPGQRGILPKAMISDYLSKAKGDKAEAERLAQADGYQTHY